MRGRRRLIRIPEIPDRPGWRDYFQMITTSLMVVLGFFVLWQTLFVKWATPSLIFSVVLLLFSAFRIRMIWAYFQQRGRKNGV